MLTHGGLPNCSPRGAVELWLLKPGGRALEALRSVEKKEYQVVSPNVPFREFGELPLEILLAAYRHFSGLALAVEQDKKTVERMLKIGDLLVLPVDKRRRVGALIIGTTGSRIVKENHEWRQVIPVGRGRHLVLMGYI